MKLVVVACLLFGCRSRAPSELPVAPAPDPHSQANPAQVAVRHLALDLRVDFEARVLRGIAALHLERRDPKATELRLDSDDLVIERATRCGDTRDLLTRLEPKQATLGQALVVALPAGGDCVAIHYTTRPEARALLWVEPGGTSGGKHPMLFTQSQAINARTWIPLQDTPGVRFTYEATIRVPAGLRAVMSAENPVRAIDGAWRFRMRQPIPSYLMALAVGDLAFQAIGPRTGVYAEPSRVAAAASEFAEVEAMMTAAERLYGPYRWDRYDILVLPPSFPYGGMENPRLTFLTPTVVTGDRSLVSLIAHELAHSWSGNLVTNSTWQDFWLNEGFTTYVERRIMEELRGVPAAELQWYLGRRDLERSFAKTGRDNPDTRLALDFGPDRSPDDVPSDAAYEKGAMLLRALERAAGRAKFDAVLREWFDRNAFRSTSTRAFEAFATAKLPAFPLASWIHEPGLPADVAPQTSAEAEAIEQAARAFVKNGTSPATDRWTTLEWVVFLRALPALELARLQQLDAQFKLTASSNAEIGMHWLPLVIRANGTFATSAIEHFLITVGRRRMVRPVYEALIDQGGTWRELAASIFARAKAGYHPVTRDTIAEMLVR
ncbi:MAG: M1 family metallopeptidase [Kofleriaceae bacterium]